MKDVQSWNQSITWIAGKEPFIKCRCLTYDNENGYQILRYMAGKAGWDWYADIDPAGETPVHPPQMYSILSGHDPLKDWPANRPFPVMRR